MHALAAQYDLAMAKAMAGSKKRAATYPRPRRAAPNRPRASILSKVPLALRQQIEANREGALREDG